MKISWFVPLASGVDGAPKQSISSFVKRVTTEGSPDFVPVPERIATFDNDGTLWCEQPVIQHAHILERWVEMAQQNPALRNQQPWKAAVDNDMTWFWTAIKKHYDGDESDMPAIAKGVLSRVRRPDDGGIFPACECLLPNEVASQAKALVSRLRVCTDGRTPALSRSKRVHELHCVGRWA